MANYSTHYDQIDGVTEAISQTKVAIPQTPNFPGIAHPARVRLLLKPQANVFQLQSSANHGNGIADKVYVDYGDNTPLDRSPAVDQVHYFTYGDQSQSDIPTTPGPYTPEHNPAAPDAPTVTLFFHPNSSANVPYYISASNIGFLLSQVDTMLDPFPEYVILDGGYYLNSDPIAIVSPNFTAPEGIFANPYQTPWFDGSTFKTAPRICNNLNGLVEYPPGYDNASTPYAPFKACESVRKVAPQGVFDDFIEFLNPCDFSYNDGFDNYYYDAWPVGGRPKNIDRYVTADKYHFESGSSFPTHDLSRLRVYNKGINLSNFYVGFKTGSYTASLLGQWMDLSAATQLEFANFKMPQIHIPGRDDPQNSIKFDWIVGGKFLGIRIPAQAKVVLGCWGLQCSRPTDFNTINQRDRVAAYPAQDTSGNVTTATPPSSVHIALSVDSLDAISTVYGTVVAEYYLGTGINGPGSAEFKAQALLMPDTVDGVQVMNNYGAKTFAGDIDPLDATKNDGYTYSGAILTYNALNETWGVPEIAAIKPGLKFIDGYFVGTYAGTCIGTMGFVNPVTYKPAEGVLEAATITADNTVTIPSLPSTVEVALRVLEGTFHGAYACSEISSWLPKFFFSKALGADLDSEGGNYRADSSSAFGVTVRYVHQDYDQSADTSGYRDKSSRIFTNVYSIDEIPTMSVTPNKHDGKVEQDPNVSLQYVKNSMDVTLPQIVSYKRYTKNITGGAVLTPMSLPHLQIVTNWQYRCFKDAYIDPVNYLSGPLMLKHPDGLKDENSYREMFITRWQSKIFNVLYGRQYVETLSDQTKSNADYRNMNNGQVAPDGAGTVANSFGWVSDALVWEDYGIVQPGSENAGEALPPLHTAKIIANSALAANQSDWTAAKNAWSDAGEPSMGEQAQAYFQASAKEEGLQIASDAADSAYDAALTKANDQKVTFKIDDGHGGTYEIDSYPSVSSASIRGSLKNARLHDCDQIVREPGIYVYYRNSVYDCFNTVMNGNFTGDYGNFWDEHGIGGFTSDSDRGNYLVSKNDDPSINRVNPVPIVDQFQSTVLRLSDGTHYRREDFNPAYYSNRQTKEVLAQVTYSQSSTVGTNMRQVANTVGEATPYYSLIYTTGLIDGLYSYRNYFENDGQYFYYTIVNDIGSNGGSSSQQHNIATLPLQPGYDFSGFLSRYITKQTDIDGIFQAHPLLENRELWLNEGNIVGGNVIPPGPGDTVTPPNPGNSPPSAIVQSALTFSNGDEYPAANIKDGDNTTYWGNTNGPAIIGYHLDNSYRVLTYTITSASTDAGHDATVWQLQGSRDNFTTFDVLDSQSGASWVGRETVNTYTVTNPGTYSYYRLYITGNGGQRGTYIAEWNLLNYTQETYVPPAPDSTPSAMVTAASVFGNGEDSPNYATNLRDGYYSTKWLNHEGPAIVGYELTQPQSVSVYTITSSNNTDRNHDLKSWTFEGSNDGNNWVTLDVQSNESWSGPTVTNAYNVANPGQYGWYRLHITENHGAYGTEAAEWNLLP